MTLNNSIITYEHDNIYSCDGGCEKCKRSENSSLCCVNFCRKEHFEELKEYCIDKNTASGFDYIPKEECISINKYTGLIQLKDGTYLEILPKLKGFSIDNSRKIFENLVFASHNLTKEYKSNKNTNVETRKYNHIVEIFVTVFCKDLKEILKKGIKKSYIRKSENLNVHKGKINFSEHIKRNISSKNRFFVDYSELSLNIAENRILKSACLYLIKQTKINKNKKVLRQMLIELDDVNQCINLDKDLQEKQINRLNLYYDKPLKYAEFFLRKQNFIPKKGSSKLPALLFPLNDMFEDYIENLLTSKKIDYKSQYKKHYLLEDNSFQTKMDLVIFKGEKVLILDAKWKEIDANIHNFGIEQSDLYQLFAYSEIIKKMEENAKEMEIVLLYPQTKQFKEVIKWKYFNKTPINIIPIDILTPLNNSNLFNFI